MKKAKRVKRAVRQMVEAFAAQERLLSTERRRARAAEEALGIATRYSHMAFLIWSQKANAWWRPNRAGYTTERAEAGRYGWQEAITIVTGSAMCGNREKVSFMVIDPGATIDRLHMGHEHELVREGVSISRAVLDETQRFVAGEVKASEDVAGHDPLGFVAGGSWPTVQACMFCGEPLAGHDQEVCDAKMHAWKPTGVRTDPGMQVARDRAAEEGTDA